MMWCVTSDSCAQMTKCEGSLSQAQGYQQCFDSLALLRQIFLSDQGFRFSSGSEVQRQAARLQFFRWAELGGDGQAALRLLG